MKNDSGAEIEEDVENIELSLAELLMALAATGRTVIFHPYNNTHNSISDGLVTVTIESGDQRSRGGRGAPLEALKDASRLYGDHYGHPCPL